MRILLPFALAPLLAACGEGPYAAPFGATIEAGQDLILSSSSAYLYQDNIGSLVIADAIVLDEEGYPLSNIEVEITTGGSGVYIIPETAVKLVDYPTAGEGIARPEQVEAACDADGDGRIDADAEDWCSWWYDMDGEEYYQFGSDYSSTTGDYRPTYYRGATDTRGILRYYLFVDALPSGSTDEADTVTYEGVHVWLSIRVDSTSYQITTDS